MSLEEFNKKISDCLENKKWSESMATSIEEKISEQKKQKSKMWILPVAAVAVIVMLPFGIKQKSKNQKLTAQINKAKKRKVAKKQRHSRPNRFEYITKMIPVSLIR